jgi:dCTP deaminase
MILTDREIQIALQHDMLVVDPLPKDEAYSSTSLDLTLDPVLSVFKDGVKGIKQTIDPSSKDFVFDEVLEQITQKQEIPQGGFEFAPGNLLLAWTHEYIHLKPHARIAARVEGKSSLARLGVGVHITAPIIHSGFEGRIRLEMVNHGKIPVLLTTGMRICQLIFEQTIGTPVRGYKGRFAGQTPEGKS